LKAEIIAVGTELLLGQVVNTNATVISEKLAGLGIDVYHHVVVGDNEKRLVEAIEQAEKRSNLIILTGGLGSTDDDLTKQVLAKYLNEELVTNEQALKELNDYFIKIGKNCTPNNMRQVLVMKNATPLANRTGLAVGAYLNKENKSYALLPGPPGEMQPMLVEQLEPLLKKKLLKTFAPIHVRVLRFFGIGEAELTTKLAKLISKQTDPTLAPYAKTSEVTLRLATKDHDLTTAMKRLSALEGEILATSNVAKYFYGYGDNNSLAQETVKLLKELGKTLTAAESLTAGMFQSMLAEVSGVSEVFKGGFVTYSLETKTKMLKISKASLLKEGTVSEFSAKNMSENARKLVDADYSLAFTGVAGPDSIEGIPAGEVWIGLAKRGFSPKAYFYNFSSTRQYVRKRAAMSGLDLLRRDLLKEKAK